MQHIDNKHVWWNRTWLGSVEKIGQAPQRMVGLVLVKTERAEDAKVDDFRQVGTVVRMHNPMRADGKIQFIIYKKCRWSCFKK